VPGDPTPQWAEAWGVPGRLAPGIQLPASTPENWSVEFIDGSN
jgi:hypothetical protein